MGKPTGFIEYDRAKIPERSIEERIRDYREVYDLLPVEELQRQAARCMDCGIPFCHALGCPISNLIPEFNDAFYNGMFEEATIRLIETSSFPEITGRICPAPCEAACTLAINSDPVNIKQLELAIIERAFDEGWIVPRPPAAETGKRVAVVGSGPAGLAAAQILRRKGHRVTLFERSEKPGGILRYGIPDFKLEKWVLDRRLEQMIAEGVQFENGVHVGEDISAHYLHKKFDAILLTMGAGQPRDLNVQGRGYEGIHFAMDYLVPSNRAVSGEIGWDRIISAKGKKVLVIGGGDTGSDCVGTAIRQGADKVYQFEIMPKPLEWDKGSNPEWPEWPRILRTSSSHKEGGERKWGIETLRFSGRGVTVNKAYFREITWTTPAPGERPAMNPVPDSEFDMEVDLVLLALGFLHVEHGKFLNDLKIETDQRGNIKVDQNYATTAPGIFAAGDSSTGASLVVRAINHGKRAADSINNFLST